MPLKRKSYATRRAAPKRARLVQRARKPRRSGRSRSASTVALHQHHRWGSIGSTWYNVTNDCTYTSTTGILLVNAGVVQAGFACAFQLNDIVNVSEFTQLYDQYKIKGVMVTIKMITNPDAQNQTLNIGGQASTNFYPTIWYCPDHDDTTAPTLSFLKQYSRVKHKILRPNQEIKFFAKPNTLTQLYDGALATAYANTKGRPWVDMANPDVPHYGFKMAIDFEGLTTGAALTGQYQFKINCKYYIACKNAR